MGYICCICFGIFAPLAPPLPPNWNEKRAAEACSTAKLPSQPLLVRYRRNRGWVSGFDGCEGPAGTPPLLTHQFQAKPCRTQMQGSTYLTKMYVFYFTNYSKTECSLKNLVFMVW